MSGTSRFVLTNAALAATLKNGTGGPAPAVEQEAPFTMTRALNRDRASYWRTSAAPPNPTLFDFDLGSAQTMDTLGIHGYRAAVTGAATTVTIQHGTTYNVWTTAGTVSLAANPRDVALLISPVSMRYVRFSIACTSQFQVGKFLVGAVTDLGVAHAPGALASPYRFRNEQAMVGGGVVIEDLGDTGRDMSIPLPQANETRRAILEALVNQTGSFAYIDPADGFYEVFVPNSARIDIQRILVAGASSLSAVDVKLVRLP